MNDFISVVPSVDSSLQAPAAGGEAFPWLTGVRNADPAPANAGQGLQSLWGVSALSEQVPALSGFFATPPMADFSAAPILQGGTAPMIAADPLQHTLN